MGGDRWYQGFMSNIWSSGLPKKGCLIPEEWVGVMKWGADKVVGSVMASFVCQPGEAAVPLLSQVVTWVLLGKS